MKRIGVLYCKKIKDVHCIGCIKCFKAVEKREGAYAEHEGEDVQVAFWADCGDCPGLMGPKVGIIKDMLDKLGVKVDAIHFSTCILKAKASAGCTLDVEGMKAMIEEKVGIPVILGGHNY